MSPEQKRGKVLMLSAFSLVFLFNGGIILLFLLAGERVSPRDYLRLLILTGLMVGTYLGYDKMRLAFITFSLYAVIVMALIIVDTPHWLYYVALTVMVFACGVLLFAKSVQAFLDYQARDAD
jgi:hypothetical protein